MTREQARLWAVANKVWHPENPYAQYPKEEDISQGEQDQFIGDPASASADAKEALQRRWDRGASLIVLPLASGKLALFGTDHQLVGLVQDSLSVEEVLHFLSLAKVQMDQASADTQARLAKLKLGPAGKALGSKSEKSLEDLGL